MCFRLPTDVGAVSYTHLYWFTYGLYGVICILAAIFVWKLVPETKGKTLEDMTKLMNYSQRMYSKTELGLPYFPDTTDGATARRHCLLYTSVTRRNLLTKTAHLIVFFFLFNF